MIKTYREAQWVMAAGSAAVEPQQLGRMAAGGLDWGLVLAFAEYERAFPVLADRIREAGVELPSEIAQQVRARAMVADFAIARLHTLLDDVVGRLAAAGIEVLLLKGAAMARTRYPSRRLRPMSDIDLLIPVPHLGRARAIIEAAGWRCRDAPGLEETYEGHHHLPPFHDPRAAGAKLELHGDLFFRGNPFGFGAATMWEHAVPHSIAGGRAGVPCARHLLLHACLHFAWGHILREGAWVAFRDVAVLAQADDLDWDLFVQESLEASAGTACYWTLRLASVLGDAVVPEAALRALAPRRPRVVLARLTDHFISRLLGAARAPERLERAIWELAIAPTRSGHGRVRPWDHDERFDLPIAVAAPDPASWKARVQAVLQSAHCLHALALGRSLPR